ncbi:MAG: hypothetical protein ACN4GK_07950 [Acidimicrobiia bacterium]
MADESGQDRIHHPVWDPPWLRALYTRCLWDGGERTSGLEFCSESCWEMYANWEHDTARRDFGREPVPGRHDERVAVLPVRTPRRRRPPQ